MENGNGEKRYRSRKWFLVLIIIVLATLGAFLPPVISSWVFGEPKPLIILSGTEWVSVISLIVAAYITGNVFQKREEIKASTSLKLNASASIGTKTEEKEGEH